MISITGDIHGGVDIAKLNSTNFPEGKSLGKSDYVIIAGDFGLVWNGSNSEKYWLNWLRQKKFTTLFVDGNHENFARLNDFPVRQWNGGNVHVINDSVYHLMRGQVFELDGNTFFTFGGASSHDREYRTENVSWWPEEMPSENECVEGLDNLKRYNWEVDYIITHACSRRTFEVSGLAGEIGYNYPETPLTMYFDRLESTVRYRHWYFGHFHCDRRIFPNHSVVFQDVLTIEGFKAQ